jgi:ubiquinone/menaquinone biosynthesis C-methylase UbiE
VAVTSDTTAVRADIARDQRRATQRTRDDRIVEGVGDLVGQPTSMLDVGCSDGRLARAVADAVGADRVEGVDVKLQPDARIPVAEYDGRVLPFPDATFDLVTIVDVLHHAEDPRAVLAESLRVLAPGGSVVVKDHVRLGPVSRRILYALDVASNYAAGIRTTNTYLALDEWVALVHAAGGAIDAMVWPFRVHDLPWRVLLPSRCHLLLRITPRE